MTAEAGVCSNTVTDTVTQCSGNAHHLSNCTIYFKEHSFCIASPASTLLHQANVRFHRAGDITPPLTRTYGAVHFLPHATHDDGDYIFKYINAKLTHIHSQLTAIANNANADADAAAMSLLQAVEQYLGSINTWPAYIITYLFAETPSTSVVEELTEFFAGNAVPKTLVYRLYSACNPEAANELVRQLFYARFSLWHSSDTVRSHSMYYDVCIKKLVRLNVLYFPDELLGLREDPIPVSGWPAPKLGVHSTATPNMINAALQLVRQEQL